MGQIPSNVNQALVLDLHRKKLAEWRERPLARPESYLNRLLCAVRKLNVRLDSATPTEIVECVNALRNKRGEPISQSSRFEIVRACNEVLASLNRPYIHNPRPYRLEDVSYIPLEVFQAKLGKLPEEYQLYLGGLYATGCRFAELPKVMLKGDGWAHISLQLRDDGRVWETKNKHKRDAAILPPLEPLIMGYKALPSKRQADLRINHYYKLYGAIVRIYGHNIHTLRHSYAIECAKVGKSVEQIAGYLGDTVDVTRRHYIGYIKPSGSAW